MAEKKEFTVFTGAMTLREYLDGCGKEEPADGIPSFVSPGWLKRLDDKGFVTKRVTEDEASA